MQRPRGRDELEAFRDRTKAMWWESVSKRDARRVVGREGSCHALQCFCCHRALLPISHCPRFRRDCLALNSIYIRVSLSHEHHMLYV